MDSDCYNVGEFDMTTIILSKLRLNFALATVTTWLGSSCKIVYKRESMCIYDNLIKHRNHEVMTPVLISSTLLCSILFHSNLLRNNEITYVKHRQHDKNIFFSLSQQVKRNPMKWIFHTCMSFFIIQRLLGRRFRVRLFQAFIAWHSTINMYYGSEIDDRKKRLFLFSISNFFYMVDGMLKEN